MHHHLVREKTRTRVGLVIETGEAREVHHFCLLLGYGAGAINPYLAFDTIRDLCREGVLSGLTERKAVKNYVKAAGKGILKVMSKMGISTVASYTGAQIFEAVGLQKALVDEYFTGTASRIEGIDLDVIAREVAARHRIAYPDRPEELAHRELPVGGEYQWRREGEYHLFNPDTVYKLQHSTRTGRYDVFKQYTRPRRQPGEAARDAARPVRAEDRRTPAGADRRGRAGLRDREAVLDRRDELRLDQQGSAREPRDRDEPARVRARTPARAARTPTATCRCRTATRSARAIKQVASGRFGVTSEYLVNADDLQIKMAQGAKPGEGGELPGLQGVPVDREDAALDARRRPDLAAAAPRHLFDRRPQAAHPRPEEREPASACAREARRRDRRRARSRPACRRRTPTSC